MSRLTTQRLIDEQGRIVLPLEARGIMSWSDKMPVEIWVKPMEDEIVIKRYVIRCFCCGNTGDYRNIGRRISAMT